MCSCIIDLIIIIIKTAILKIGSLVHVCVYVLYYIVPMTNINVDYVKTTQ